MYDQIIGQRVYDADGGEIGTVKEVRGERFKVDAPMQPDYWLRTDRLRAAGGRLVVTDAVGGSTSPDEREMPADGPYAHGDTDGETRWGAHGHIYPGQEREGMERERLEDEGEESIRLREERLRVGREREQVGEVEVGKRVVEQVETAEVPLREERVVVERRPVNQPATSGVDLHDETIEVPVERERAVAGKEAVVTEEVTVRKDTVERAQPVEANLRKEELVVESEGDVVEGGRDPHAPREADDRRGTTRRG